jgi:hypothetical protein
MFMLLIDMGVLSGKLIGVRFVIDARSAIGSRPTFMRGIQAFSSVYFP